MTIIQKIVLLILNELHPEPLVFNNWSEFLISKEMTTQDFKDECIYICECEAVYNGNWNVLLDEDGSFIDENGSVIKWYKLLNELKRAILKNNFLKKY